MLYLDNIIFSLQKHGGVSVLWGHLINSLLGDGGIATSFFEYKNSNLNRVRNTLSIPSDNIIVSKNPIILERYKNVTISKCTPAILHSSHYRISNNHNVSNITTVHDFTYEYYFHGLPKKIHCWQKYKAIQKSKVIICISENTKKDLIRFLPEIKNDKIRVIYNGVSSDYYPLHRIDNEPYEDYLLFVGGRQSYKNFKFAVACAKTVGKKLLIVGGSLSHEENKLLHEELGAENFKAIIHPSNEELNRIYNSVICLIYPSLYEGFGIPVVEAQKAGCPVIAMNSSSIPEVIGNKALLLDYSDTSEFERVYKNMKANRSEFIIEGLEYAKKFSWDNMTKEYMNIYKELLP